MAVVSCRRADCCFFFVKQEGNESCFRSSKLTLNVIGVFVKHVHVYTRSLTTPIVPEAVATHEGNDQ